MSKYADVDKRKRALQRSPRPLDVNADIASEAEKTQRRLRAEFEERQAKRKAAAAAR